MADGVVASSEECGAEQRQRNTEPSEPRRPARVECEHSSTGDDQQRAGEYGDLERLVEQDDREEHGEERRRPDQDGRA